MSQLARRDRKGKGKTSRSLSTAPMSQAKLRSEIRNEIRKQELKELELKFFDTPLPGTYTVAGSLTPISNIPQGVGQSQRIGDEVTPVELTITQTNFAVASGVPGNAWRFMILEWFMNTVPTVAQILTAASPTSETLWANNDLFVVLFEGLWSAPANAVAGVCDSQTKPCWLDKPIPLRAVDVILRDGTHARPRKQTFNPGATTGASQLYILMIATVATNVTAGQSRLQYKDG